MRLIPAVLFAAAAACCVKVAAAGGDEEEVRPMRTRVLGTVEGRWMVDMRATATQAEREAVRAALASRGVAVEELRFGADDGFTVYVATGLSADAVPAVRAMAGVADVEQDTEVQMEQSSCTGRTGSSSTTWGQRRITDGKDSFTHQASWGEGVDVYVLDTGIRCSHQEFEGRCKWGKNFAGGIEGDAQGHGTHVAGTVAGKTYGVAPSARVIAVKVLGDNGKGYNTWSMKALSWVQEQVKQSGRPGVINMSLGGGRLKSYNDAIDAVVRAGITVVVAAGNDNQDACYESPASAPEAITVASSTNNDQLSSFSNWGACTDIIAPGSSVVSAGNRYDSETSTKSGTSMACPHVAGAAAVYLSQDKKATPAQVLQWMKSNAESSRIYGSLRRTPNLLLKLPCGGPVKPDPQPSTGGGNGNGNGNGNGGQVKPDPQPSSGSTCTDLTVNGGEWRSKYGGHGCIFYVGVTTLCTTHGMGSTQVSASEACCVCGGGSKGGSAAVTPAPTDDSAKPALPAKCTDLTVNGRPWAAAGGVSCEIIGHSQLLCSSRMLKDGMYTPREACCSCGGGQRDASAQPVKPCTDKTENGRQWESFFGDKCDRAAVSSIFCRYSTGSMYSAREACCACGGGQR